MSFTDRSSNRPTSNKKALSEQNWTAVLMPALVIGLIVFGIISTDHFVSIKHFFIGLLVGGCATVTGGVLGFLFGIPRAIQEPQAQGRTPNGSKSGYETNTNLEQISDWLTKIIVGATLINLDPLSTKFGELSRYVATSFDNPTPPVGIVSVALAYFGIVGFLIFYLWTRLFLRNEFERSDRSAKQSPEFAEGLIQAYLYQPSPHGFESAISTAAEYNQQVGESNWRVWRSLACAYGQKYTYLQYSKASEADLNQTKADALDAVDRVLFLNPNEREGLRALWDSSIATPEENDLVVFFGDPEFEKRLKRTDEGGH